MSPTHSSDDLVARDARLDENDEQGGVGLPYTQVEIEELVYGSDQPVGERLARLRALRDEMVTAESADYGDEDPADMLAEIDRAIGELEADEGNADDTDDYAALSPGYTIDPADHSETLSPDDDALEALDDEDEADDDLDDLEVLDETEWEDGDKFDPSKGVK